MDNVVIAALKWEISNERSDHLRFPETHCHSAPHVKETLANIRTNLALLICYF